MELITIRCMGAVWTERIQPHLAGCGTSVLTSVLTTVLTSARPYLLAVSIEYAVMSVMGSFFIKCPKVDKKKYQKERRDSKIIQLKVRTYII